MRFKTVTVGVIVGFMMMIGTVYAASYTQKSNALTQYSLASLRSVNNSQTAFVPAGTYQFARSPHGSNTLKTVAGNQKWTLKTLYQLPTTHAAKGDSRYDMTNPQSMAYDGGHYFYVVYQPRYNKAMANKGFVARFDTTKLNKMSFTQVQSAMNNKSGNSAIKVGGVFTTGHGQSLAYDQKHHMLYMWRDTSMKATKTATIQRINNSSLMPNRLITFHMVNHGTVVPGGHELTFDHSGNAYYWTVSGSKVKVYKGTIGSKSVHFRLTKQLLTHRPGTHEQAMGYNAHNGRLYLVADDSVTSFPAKKLNGKGSLRPNDFKYSRFNSHREFESLTFDRAGHGNLLANRNPEILKSSKAY